MMTTGALLLMKGDVSGAIDRLKAFDDWVEGKLASSPSEEFQIVLLFDRFESLPALAMAYKRNGEEALAKASWEGCLKAGEEHVELSGENPQVLRNLWLRYRFGKAMNFLEATEVDERIDELTEEIKRRRLFNEEAEEALKELFEEMVPK